MFLAFLDRPRTNRPVGATDRIRLGEMEISANLPFLAKHHRRFLKAHHARVVSQIFKIERINQNHGHRFAAPKAIYRVETVGIP